jgi:hypothetical protein
MHTEHLNNLHPGWVVGGWLVAVAVTSAVYLGIVGIGLLPSGSGAVVGVLLSMAVGFYAGGLFVGVRWSDAPILHAGAITLTSIIIWFLGSLAAPGSLQAWSGATPSVLGIILLQFAAAALGGWMGRRMTTGDASEAGTGTD